MGCDDRHQVQDFIAQRDPVIVARWAVITSQASCIKDGILEVKRVIRMRIRTRKRGGDSNDIEGICSKAAEYHGYMYHRLTVYLLD